MKELNLVFYGEKCIERSRIFNTDSGFGHFFNVRITKRYVPAHTVLNQNCVFWPRRKSNNEKTDIKKLGELSTTDRYS